MDFATRLICAASTAAALAAQNTETIPANFDLLPGNAAVSIPGRWTWGRMHVIFDEALFAGRVGQSITGLRLRRPSFFDEPAYTARTMTFEISLGPSSRMARDISGNPNDNYDPANPMQVVYAQQSYAIPATAPAADGDLVGETLIDVTLDQPFVVPSGTPILLEWRTIDASLTVLAGGWVDAVWLLDGDDLGLARHVGQRGCGSHGLMRLDVAPANEHPQLGETTTYRLIGAQGDAACHFALGLNVLVNTPGGLGSDLSLFPFVGGCQLWTPLDFFLSPTTTNAAGEVDFAFDFPDSNALQGIDLGVQAFVVETDDQGLPSGVAASNGVVCIMDTIGLSDQASTALYPQDDDSSSWLPWIGLTPVIEFVY